MIQRLDHSDKTVAEHIHHVFQKSYSVEAALLGAKDFPPLQRTPEDLQTSNTVFYGFYMDAKPTAVIELAIRQEAVHIQSLVVLPDFFRMGIASSLLSFAFVTYPAKQFTVATGLKNEPAAFLYKKFGFIETKQWDTDHGIRKIGFEKRF